MYDKNAEGSGADRLCGNGADMDWKNTGHEAAGCGKTDRTERMVLCGANAYEQKYYFNGSFDGIPQSIKDELHIICVLFTEEVGGIFTVAFEADGNIVLETDFAEDDFLYDEIGSGLMVREVRQNRQELFESLSLYYKICILHEEIDTGE